MLSKNNKQLLLELMKENISGIVLRNDLKKWLIELQKQNSQFLGNCTGEDLLNTAKKVGINVVDTKAIYETMKDRYNCKLEVPNLACRKPRPYNYRTLDKEVLEEMVVNKKMRQSDIAKELHTSTNTVARYIREYEIKGRNQQIHAALTKELLEELYIKQDLSPLTIAKMIGCSKNVVYKNIEKFNLKECC